MAGSWHELHKRGMHRYVDIDKNHPPVAAYQFIQAYGASRHCLLSALDVRYWPEADFDWWAQPQ